MLWLGLQLASLSSLHGKESKIFFFPSLTLSFLNVDTFLMLFLGQEVSKEHKNTQIPYLKDYEGSHIFSLALSPALQ